MPNLLAMSFEGELAPSFDLRCLLPGRKLPDGWGIGYYPGSEPSASVLKESAPPAGSIRGELVKSWEHPASSIFVLHIRAATWGSVSDANTQPFLRNLGGRDFLIAHSGSLEHRIEPAAGSPFEPVGSTDTELVFCRFLSFVASAGKRSLGEIEPVAIRAFLDELNAYGQLSLVITDGRDLLIYADRSGTSPLYLWQAMPPYGQLVLGDEDVEVDLTRRGRKSCKGILVSSSPLVSRAGGEISWERVTPGSLLLVRQGALRARVDAPPAADAPPVDASATPQLPPALPSLRHTRHAEVKKLEIIHRTVYRYTRPVEKSTHVFRLTPLHDRLQSLLEHELHLSVAGQTRDYEDVFGNRVRRLHVETPFTELVVDVRSVVMLFDTDPLDYRPLRARSAIPLVWMPWQRHMLQPYLLPPELAESELDELVEYAMSFVKRNDFDLLDTLLDMNWTIFKEYRYQQGSTTLSTTPFDVYANRRGVCQDFANLFICLSRLLGVPARYVCGYIFTGPKNDDKNGNQAQGEASHAWVQVYLPEVGWKGFDPTNGVLTQTDHVRVAVGRNYLDATPTSGTIYVGGGGETLEVEVRCEPVP